jgi:ribosome biogenesis protein MAK21
MKSVLKKGTLGDKLAAHTLLIQNSSLHSLQSIKTMMEFVDAKGKREFLLASGHLKELFLADLLPPDRKLKSFSELIRLMDHSLQEKERKIFLMVSYFEDQLKLLYQNFIKVIELNSHDPTGTTKNKSVDLLYELLAGNPEQEQFLLEHLVNKLGDPIPKVASHSCYLLRMLITEEHPAMKEVVVKEVERVLFRPNIRERAQYYCLCFLQEVIFGKDDEKVANRLVDIYLSFFKKCIEEGEVNNKTMKALLTGLSRALPFASHEVGNKVLKHHLDTFYRMVYLVNTNIGIQILSLIFQVVSMNKGSSYKMKQKTVIDKKTKLKAAKVVQTESQGTSSTRSTVDEEKADFNRIRDRFCSSLFRFLLQKDVFESTTRPGMLFNLLYRCLKSDDNSSRLSVFIKRLLQVRIIQ